MDLFIILRKLAGQPNALTQIEAIAKVFEHMPKGTVFSVRFVKRTNGQERIMRCRFGVKSHLRGGERAYNPLAKALFTVFDMDKRGYRSIPWEGIRELRIDGRTYPVQ